MAMCPCGWGMRSTPPNKALRGELLKLGSYVPQDLISIEVDFSRHKRGVGFFIAGKSGEI